MENNNKECFELYIQKDLASVKKNGPFQQSTSNSIQLKKLFVRSAKVNALFIDILSWQRYKYSNVQQRQKLDLFIIEMTHFRRNVFEFFYKQGKRFMLSQKKYETTIIIIKQLKNISSINTFSHGPNKRFSFGFPQMHQVYYK